MPDRLSRARVLEAFNAPAKVTAVAEALGADVDAVAFHAYKLERLGFLMTVGRVQHGPKGGRPARVFQRAI